MRAVEAGRPLGEVMTGRQKGFLLASLVIAMFIGAVDQTVVSTAMPRILADLGGFHLLSWVFTSYMLSSTVVVPLVGKLSDTFGRKPFLLAGILIFLVTSVACGLSPNMESLIVFRAVQGLGGGMIFACVFATVGDIFPPAQRSKFMGLFTGVFSLASLLGPTLGGFLTDNGAFGVAGWRLVFLINMPVCLVALPAIWWNLPGRHGVNRPSIDWLGAGLLTVAAVVLLLALEWAGREYPWGSPQIIGLLSGAVVLTGLFIAQEARHSEAILPLYLFKNPVFLVSNLIVFVMGVGMMGSLQYLGIFLQTALDTSATASGLIGTPQSLGLLAASVSGGFLISRTGRYKVQTLAGALLATLAMALLATNLDLNIQKWQISGIMVILGVGFGLMMPTLSLSVQNAVSYQHLGVASSASQFFRQIGGVFGIAIFAAILTSQFGAEFDRQLDDTTRTALGAQAVEFRDPTLPLNPAKYREVTTAVSEENGPATAAILGATRAAQKEAMASAVHIIFLVSTLGAAISVLLCFFLKEVPLRKTFQVQEGPEEAGREPGAAGVGLQPSAGGH